MFENATAFHSYSVACTLDSSNGLVADLKIPRQDLHQYSLLETMMLHPGIFDQWIAGSRISRRDHRQEVLPTLQVGIDPRLLTRQSLVPLLRYGVKWRWKKIDLLMGELSLKRIQKERNVIKLSSLR